MSIFSLRRLRLLVAFALWMVPATVFADTVTLAWDPSDGATGYTVKWGTSEGVYPNVADAGNTTTFNISGLTAGGTYWTVVQAYTADNVSDYSTPLQFTVPLTTPPPCTYSISPTSVSVGSTATSGSITVTTQVGCAWSATSGSSILTFENGSGRTGSGTLTFSVAANSTTTARTATATVAGNAFSVSQAASQACTYSINPTSLSVASTSASGTITVTTQDSCAWSAVSASSFLTFQDGTGRTGSGSTTFAVAANTGTTSRTGTATVAGQTFTVAQAAPPACTYSITPTSGSAPAGGTTGTITVTTQDGCAWSATTTSTFLTFSNGSGRSGSGTVSYVVAANTTAFRTATATVAGQYFSLWQAAPSCTYSISPATVNASAAASTGTVTVSTQSGCAWSATSYNSFLTFQNGTGRSGPGSVGFSIAENTGAARTAPGVIAGVSFTVAQAGATSTQPSTPSSWSSDFNGDGKNDILVQDSALGTVDAWFLDNAVVKGTQTLSDTLDANWALVGRGDFDVDGKPDLVWQHKTDGQVSLWYMDGTTRTGSVALSNGQLWDPQWKVVGVGDFNADGHADLAWQHAGDGRLTAWLMNGSTVTATSAVSPSGVTDLLWKVVGVGHFNTDSTSDLLWRHMGTGEMGVWLMNGLSRIIHSPLSPYSVPDQRWQVGAVTDANADGMADIVWHHTDGTIMIWHMNGTSRVTYPIVSPGLPAGWRLVGPK